MRNLHDTFDGPDKKRLLAAMLVCVLLAASPLSFLWARDISEPVISDALESVFADSRFQVDFPKPEKPERSNLPELRPKSTGVTLSSPASTGGGAALVWIMLAIAVAIVVWVLFSNGLPGTGWKKNSKTTKADIAAIDSPAKKASHILEEADAFAEKGEYAHAILLLLKLSVDLVKHQFDHHLVPSLTNREILRKATLDNGAKTAFGHIVELEELSQFAKLAMERHHFDHCREQFVLLSEALAQKTAQEQY